MTQSRLQGLGIESGEGIIKAPYIIPSILLTEHVKSPKITSGIFVTTNTILEKSKSTQERIYALIKKLANGAFHAGDNLASELLVSHSVICNDIKVLETLGLKVNEIPGRGYQLTQPIHLYEQNKILSAMSSTDLCEIEILPWIGSSNTYLQQKCKNKNLTKHFIFVESQINGKGRQGKQWSSPFGTNLYCSIAWIFNKLDKIVQLPLFIGIMALELLRQMGVENIELKWPNDLLVQGEKIAGILIDSSIDASNICQTVIGIGINIEPTCGMIDINQPWTSLQLKLGKSIDKNIIAKMLIDTCLNYLPKFEDNGLEIFAQTIEKVDYLRNKQIQIIQSNVIYNAHCLGIQSDGSLKVNINGNIKTIYSGDISVREYTSNT